MLGLGVGSVGNVVSFAEIGKMLLVNLVFNLLRGGMKMEKTATTLERLDEAKEKTDIARKRLDEAIENYVEVRIAYLDALRIHNSKDS